MAKPLVSFAVTSSAIFSHKGNCCWLVILSLILIIILNHFIIHLLTHVETDTDCRGRAAGELLARTSM